MTANLTDPIFHDETKAREHFERIRWPEGPVCPHCGAMNVATLVKGKSHRAGMYQCNACREPFTVKVGTVMEASHLPYTKWALGFHLYASSKKGFSAHQLHRTMGITYKSAWFMAHRIRMAMDGVSDTKLGTDGGTVEIDETYQGRIPGEVKRRGGGAHKRKIVSLVERGGEVRSFHVQEASTLEVHPILRKELDKSARVFTDELRLYDYVKAFASEHQKVNHSKDEYVRGEVHTNTIEGYFSIFKRGMTGVYQHCSTQHLHRYLAEFDFRYSNRIAVGVDDVLRTMRAIKGAEGKRLTYRQSSSAKQA